MEHTVFSTYKLFIKIIFIKNFFTWRFIQRGSRSSPIIILLGTKFDIVFVIVSLKTGTCSLTFKSMSADSQSKKSAALFIWSEFPWEKCHTVFS